MIHSVVQSPAEVMVDLNEKRPIRVLHVDDEPGLLKIAKQLLETEGQFQVDTASTAEEALEKMKKETYDAVISDYQMSGKNGLELLKDLRQNGSTVPFIIFTGKSREEVAIKALNLGADRYLDKTGDPETVYCELAHAINEAVERKRAQEKLRESEERFRLLFDNMAVGVVLVDRDGFVVAANQAQCSFLGYAKQELMGMHFSRYLSGDDLERGLVLLGEMVEGKRDNYTADRKYKRKDGVLVWGRSSGSAVRNEEGQFKYLVAVVEDITESKKAESALSESEERFRSVVDSAAEGVVTIDADMKVIFWNKAAEKIFGYSADEIIGKPVTVVVPLASRTRHEANMRKWFSSEMVEAKPSERLGLRKDGTEFPTEISYSFWKTEKGRFITGIVHDITERKTIENSFRTCSEEYTRLFDSMVQGIIIFDEEGKISSANQAAANILRYSSPKELVGKAHTELYANPEEQKALLEQLTQKSHVEGFEAALKRKDDSQVCIRASITLLRDAEGNMLRTESVFKEISELDNAEEELRELREKLDVLFEHAPDAYYINDLKGVFVAGNKAAEKMTGYGRNELIGKSFLKLNLLPRNQIPKAARLLAMNALGRPTGPDEFTLNRNDGTQVQVEIRTFPAKLNGRTLILGIAREVTKRKKDERTVIESKQKFEGLFTGNPEATVYLDQNFRILDVNPRFTSLFGYSRKEVKGKVLNDVVVPKSCMEEAKMLDSKAGEGYVYHDTVRAKKDGSLVQVSVSAAPIIIQDQLAGYIGVYKDISKLKKTEEELQKAMENVGIMNEKLRVVGDLTRHDVRNKLSTITGNTYLARKELTGNRKVSDYLREMETAIRQVVKIFDFAKTYEMLGVEGLAYVEVERTINEATSLFSDMKGAKVLNECHGLTVLADSLLRQLFYNLMDNSLKYGKKITKIRIHYEKTGEDDLRLIYEDDGVGIPDSEKPKLFKEGYSSGGSTGYGLYLIKKMMEFYGWTIKETGIAAKGAQFTITIPKKNQNGNENYQLT